MSKRPRRSSEKVVYDLKQVKVIGEPFQTKKKQKESEYEVEKLVDKRVVGHYDQLGAAGGAPPAPDIGILDLSTPTLRQRTHCHLQHRQALSSTGNHGQRRRTAAEVIKSV